jgi:hypothetical protein
VASPIRVDIDELDSLARSLRTVQSRVAAFGRSFEHYDRAIGAPQVRERLSDIVGNWSRARERIGEEVARLAAMAEGAAAVYRATEAAITKAATPSPPSGP